MFLDYFALGVIVFVAVFLFYGIIVIHDIPYEIAKKRNHPQQDALHVAGWVSLFTLHAIWPFLWIWATLYREDRGWGFNQVVKRELELEDEVKQLTQTVVQLEQRLQAVEGSSAQTIAASQAQPSVTDINEKES
ncbi:GTPase [Shewanella colwelliana]|uniref:GTPase n=1 Tax=Shewanella colwelliana TaxID=23 RepID=A0A1E5IRR6_SHECO|nr:DUF3302 domain-containing protein [Shewanella colwelliana]MDX1279778.1 DUF3302 domain-containing protein [Shewanella colwelliana]OEG72643.1 GTPase [Shewanella colwelliana]GIU20509.1 GTPase [Shewanella colwelliana]GIU45235.1 GTPase [Shewanella colwelliana]